MATNPMLAHTRVHQPQIDLLNSLLTEAIQAQGVDMLYLPRERGEDVDHLLGEAPSQSFPKTYCIEMYVAEHLDHDGANDLMSKFGMEFSDSAEFQVVVTRFATVLKRAGINRPREGDLIYYPQADSIFEIKRVMQDEYFKQFGVNVTYRLRCTLFRPSHEATPKEELPEFEGLSDTVITEDNLLAKLGINRALTGSVSDVGGVVAFDPNNPLGE